MPQIANLLRKISSFIWKISWVRACMWHQQESQIPLLPERRKTCFTTEKEHERDDRRTRKGGLQEKKSDGDFGAQENSLEMIVIVVLFWGLYNWDANLCPTHNGDFQNLSRSVILQENKNIENNSKNSLERKQVISPSPLTKKKFPKICKFSFSVSGILQRLRSVL